MKSNLYLALYFVALLFIPSCSMTPNLDSVSIKIPEGFNEMPDKLLKEKYTLKRKPRKVYSNIEATTTIASDFSLSKTTDQEIPRFLKNVTEIYRDSAKIHSSKMIDVAGKKCGYLEMSPQSVNKGAYEIMLFTSHKGQLFSADFHSTTSEYPKYKNLFQESIMSLRFEE